MTTSDGTVQGATQISGAAPRNRAFSIVLLADGFTAAQQTDFNNACAAFVTALLATPPYDALVPAINIWRVNVASTDSGADDPVSGGGTGATARTYFDSSFGGNGIRRLLICNNTTVLVTAAAQVPEFSVAIVVVNSTIYGGSGGSVGTYSLAGGATEIAIHEIGHTAYGLADEYPYYAGGAETGHDHHPATEPTEPNVTINTDRATLKWGWAVAATTALPTMSNPDCSTVDSRPSPVPSGTVGLFEGSHYFHCGAFRPEYNCKMRALSVPFCAVCRQVIRNRIGPLMTAPPAVADPTAYAFTHEARNLAEQHNLFRTGDGHIHALWFNFESGWHHEDRTAMLGAPPAVSDPIGYTFTHERRNLAEQHNLFRTGDGHTHALWFNFESGWHHEDRTAMLGAPASVGDPFGYTFTHEGRNLAEQHNLFRTGDGHIHALWFNFESGWHHEDRTAMLGAPASVGDPFGYTFTHEGRNLAEQHNLFRTGDGHIHALWFNFESGWHHEDRTAMLGAPPAVSDPFGYTFTHEARNLAEQHNLFRTGDGHIHALWFNFESGWHHEDRTAMLGAPASVGDPFGYTFTHEARNLAEQHNLFRTGDGHIHALWFNFESGWHHEDRSL
ncbi:M64 family metallopeptidase [Terrabacter sp. 2YAF2]|uniref:M64 family metallopeptidase n=1 Tax=Terrabacter sp. 2YAF2 TaxID=3233026 RepID=UPI003F9EA218